MFKAGKLKSDPRFKLTLDKLARLQVTCGLHTRKEKLLVWKLAEQTREGAIVEIGSFEGYSTILLAEAANTCTKIFAIDPHVGKLCESDEEESHFTGDTWQTFNKNIQYAGVANKIRALKLKSEEAVLNWRNPIGLLFIDGSHKYEDVKKDVLLWKPHLIPGGVVVFHDLWISGVRKVITERILSDNTFGDFAYAPCCMFAARYFGDKYVYQILQRNFWRLLLRLRGTIEKWRMLRRWLHVLLRRVS